METLQNTSARLANFILLSWREGPMPDPTAPSGVNNYLRINAPISLGQKNDTISIDKK